MKLIWPLILYHLHACSGEAAGAPLGKRARHGVLPRSAKATQAPALAGDTASDAAATARQGPSVAAAAAASAPNATHAGDGAAANVQRAASERAGGPVALPRKPRAKRKASSEAGTAREAASAAGSPAVLSATAKRRRPQAADPLEGGAREGFGGPRRAAGALVGKSVETPGIGGSSHGVAAGQEQRREGVACAGSKPGSRKARKKKAVAEKAQLVARPEEPGSVVGGAPPAPRPATQGPAADPAQRRAAGKSRQRGAEAGADGAGSTVFSDLGPPAAAAGAPPESAAAANPAEDPAPRSIAPLAPRAAAAHPLVHPRKPGKRNKFKPWAGASAAAPEALPHAATMSGAAAMQHAAQAGDGAAVSQHAATASGNAAKPSADGFAAAPADGAAARLPDAFKSNGVAAKAEGAHVKPDRKRRKVQGLAQPEFPGSETAGTEARPLPGTKMTAAGRSAADATGLQTPRQRDPGPTRGFAGLVDNAARSEQAAARKGGNPDPEPGHGLLGEMRARLAGGRFRWLNERLYTAPSAEALALMQAQPELFEQYHEVRS